MSKTIFYSHNQSFAVHSNGYSMTTVNNNEFVGEIIFLFKTIVLC